MDSRRGQSIGAGTSECSTPSDCSECRQRAAENLKKAEELQVCASKILQLEKKVKFLKEFEPGPMSVDFPGDVVLMGRDNKLVKAHRFVLAARCPVLRQMMNMNKVEADQEAVMGVIRVPELTYPIIRLMVNFFYTGEVTFSSEISAEMLLSAARKYMTRELKAACEENLLRDIGRKNILLKFQLARLHGLHLLEKEATRYVKDNFDEIFPIVNNANLGNV